MSRKIVDYSVSLAEGAAIYDDAEASAMDRLRADGLYEKPQRPRDSEGAYFTGQLPSNLVSLPSVEFVEYYNLMLVWHEYVSTRTLLAKAALSSARAKLKLVKAKVRKSKNGAAHDKDDETEMDVRYIEATAAVMELETYYILASANEEASRKKVAFCSRIIETKKLAAEQGRRADSVHATPRAFTPQSRRRKRP